jgi:hypothetical protein
MGELEVIERIGTNAVKKLRDSKLAAGVPFMINSKDLPSKQSYLEFPDHSIQIVTVSADAHSFITVKVLDVHEADLIRLKYSLI